MKTRRNPDSRLYTPITSRTLTLRLHSAELRCFKEMRPSLSRTRASWKPRVPNFLRGNSEATSGHFTCPSEPCLLACTLLIVLRSVNTLGRDHLICRSRAIPHNSISTGKRHEYFICSELLLPDSANKEAQILQERPKLPVLDIVRVKTDQHSKPEEVTSKPIQAQLPVSFAFEGPAQVMSTGNSGPGKPLSAFARVCTETGSMLSMSTAELKVRALLYC